MNPLILRRLCQSALFLPMLALLACSTNPTRDRPPLAEVAGQAPAENLVVLMYPGHLLVRPDLRATEPDDDDDSEEGIEGYLLDLLWNRATQGLRERPAEAVRSQIDGQAFAERLADTLRTQLPDDLLAPDAHVQVSTGPINAVRGMRQQQTNLMLTVSAGFNYTLEGFFVETEVTFMPAGRPSVHTRYVSEFVNPERYGRFRLIERRKPNAEYWSANGSAAVHRALEQAIQELVRAIDTDFRYPQPVPAKTQRFYSYAAEQSPQKVAAVLESTPTRSFVVTSDGQYWLDRIQLERPRMDD